MPISPIILFVYKRLTHTQRTIEALKKDSLSSQSSLFIFSDGPKNKDEEAAVSDVRNFIKRIEGFAEISIKEQTGNKGLANSIISGVSEVIGKFERAIILEDDIVCSPNFLEFMNDALDFYKNAKNIFSVSGYSFPLNIPSNYNKDIYLLPRASTWGWGTWSDRWNKADWQVKDFDKFRKNKQSQKLFNAGGGDQADMLKSQMLGLIDSWGIRWSYTHFKNNAFCVYPVKSKLVNIGADKSGTHTARTNKFDVAADPGGAKTKFETDLKPDQRIVSELQSFYRQSIYRKIVNYIKFNIIKN